MRNINIIGDITEETFKEFHTALGKIEAKGLTEAQVTLMSHGGDAMAGLAIFDRMALSPISFTVVATGFVASAAVVILAAGDKKVMTPCTWVMVHEEQVDEIKSTNVTHMEQNAHNYRKLEKQWCSILAQNSTTSMQIWEHLHRQDTYLDPTECLKLGLIDEILSE